MYIADLKERYKAGKVGDIEVKGKLAGALNAFLDPLRERRSLYAEKKGFVDEVIYSGTIRMRKEAAETLSEMKKAMGITSVWNRISRKAEEARKKAGE